MSILSKIKQTNHKQIALLIDPDKYNKPLLTNQIDSAIEAKVDYIFLGGSLISNDASDLCISLIKSKCTIPIIIFPGNGTHLNANADAILFLSLISGRNADLLIGNHVHVAPMIKRQKIESISTGYMLIESGTITTAQYISNTLPIPHNKSEVAVATAIAGEMLGLKMIYLDGGSGAQQPISEKMISAVKANISLPLIVGGGIRNKETAMGMVKAGADLIVVGNAAEENPKLIIEIAKYIREP